ncbi:serine/threonine-protein kinase PSK2 [Tachysurus ichikawai]
MTSDQKCYYLSRVQEFSTFQFFTEELTSHYIIGELLGYGFEGSVFAGVRIEDRTEVAIKFTIIDEFQKLLVIVNTF